MIRESISADRRRRMRLSAWLRALVAVLGLTKTKPGRIEEVERAAIAVEVAEVVIDESEQKQ